MLSQSKHLEPQMNNTNFSEMDESMMRKNDDQIIYRDHAFKTQDLLNMRVLIHQKIEQVFERATLWTNIMPHKIFSDLVSFNASATGFNPQTVNTQERSR